MCESLCLELSTTNLHQAEAAFFYCLMLEFVGTVGSH